MKKPNSLPNPTARKLNRDKSTPSFFRAFTLATLLPAVVTLICLAACQPEQLAETDGPEGTYSQFISALEQKDSRKVLSLSTENTQKLADEIFDGLKELEKVVREDFPLGPREKALESGGLPLLARGMESPDLFAQVIGLNNLNVDSGVKHGATVVSVEHSKEKNSAVITTLGGDQVALVKEMSGEWKVPKFEPVLDKLVKEVRQNLRTVRKYKTDLDAQREEIQKRLKR